MRIIKEKTAGLIIDVQEKLFPHMDAGEQLEKNLQVLLSGLKVLEVPVLLTEQYVKGLGPTIHSVRTLVDHWSPVEKLSFSCCDEPLFYNTLKSIKPEFVVVAGIEAHVCVLQTVVDLISNGFIPVVVEDCISSRKPSDKNTAVKRMRQEGAIISSYESLLFELTRYSGTGQFKAISKLVK